MQKNIAMISRPVEVSITVNINFDIVYPHKPPY